jgi:hypothetical protein
MRPRIAAALVALALTACKDRPVVRLANTPSTRTLAELRLWYGDEAIVPCELPSRPALAFPFDRDTMWTVRAGSVRIQRVQAGAIGPAWIQDLGGPVVSRPTCEVAAGRAGVIWRRYAPAPANRSSPPLHGAIGEWVSADSTRVRLSVYAASDTALDAMLGALTAMLRPGNN